jgi:hypothetical protein
VRGIPISELMKVKDEVGGGARQTRKGQRVGTVAPDAWPHSE